MATAQLGAVLRHIRRLAADPKISEQTDGALLRAFLGRNDQGAFETLLRRHGPMVLRVCRRTLGNAHDAEDAFQATFLVLARQATSIRKKESLASWLHGVAYRMATHAKRAAARRRAHESRVSPISQQDPALGAAWQELQVVLDEEIERLPESLRAPFVYCCLENRSCAEAAQQLGLQEANLRMRLSRARKRLQERLTRRGVSLATVLAAAAVGENEMLAALSQPLVGSTVKAAAQMVAGDTLACGLVPAKVLILMKGANQAMFLSKCKMAILLLLGTAIVSAGLGLAARQSASAEPPLWLLDAPAAEKPPAPQALAPGQPQAPEKETRRSDAFGDPLPAGAIARLGSLRLYHDSDVGRVVLSPDGKWVVAWDKTGNRLWDARTGKESPLAHDLRMATFLATADRLVAVKKENDRIILWDVAAAKEIAKLPLEDGASDEFELSPDGKTLVCSSSQRVARHKLVFIDVAKATVRHSIDLGDRYVCQSGTGHQSRGLAFSADGSTLAVHYWGNWVDVLDAKTNTVRYSCVGGAHVSLSPDGSMVAGVSHTQKQVRLWDVRAKKELEPLPLDPARSKLTVIHAVAFSPDGELLAVTGEAEVGVYDLATRKLVQRLKGTGPELYDLVFSQDGTRLAAGDDRAVALWDLKTGELCHDLGHGNAIAAVAFSPDGQTIVTGATYSDNVVRSWDALTGKIKGHMRGHTDGIEAIAFAPDGLLVASSSTDGTVRLWDAATGKEIGCLDARDGAVSAIAFSPDGKTLASGGERKVVHLWDVATRKQVRAFNNPGGRTVCLAFSPDGQTLATRGAEESRVRIWDVAAGTQRREFGGLSAGSYRLLALGRPRLSFAPDNRTLAVNCDDGTVHLLDVTTGKELRVLGESQLAPAVGAPGGGPAGCPCLGVTFAPDGRSLAASYDASYNPNYSNLVRVWEVASGRERTRFKRAHAGFVMVLAYSPDGTLLVTGGTDRTALVWDLFGLRTSDQKKADFTSEDVDRLWADLADADAGKAFGALQVLRANGTPAVSLLKERLRPAAASDPKKIARLIADLDQEDFTARESATKELSKLGDLAESALRAALNDKPSAEKRRRVEDLLTRLDPLRGVRAVEVLESLGTPEARQVLQVLARGAAEARLTREAKASLERRKR